MSLFFVQRPRQTSVSRALRVTAIQAVSSFAAPGALVAPSTA
jgi:hypothetical protein